MAGRNRYLSSLHSLQSIVRHSHSTYPTQNRLCLSMLGDCSLSRAKDCKIKLLGISISPRFLNCSSSQLSCPSFLFAFCIHCSNPNQSNHWNIAVAGRKSPPSPSPAKLALFKGNTHQGLWKCLFSRNKISEGSSLLPPTSFQQQAQL